MPFSALFVVGWLLGCAALVSGRIWLFAVGAPFLILCGLVSFVSRAAWNRLTAAALTSAISSSDYRERVRTSDSLRRFWSALLLVIGLGWLAMGLRV